MNIVIIAFNFAHAGRTVNGPGMCLNNFNNILKNNKHNVSIFTEIKNKNKNIFNIKNKEKFISSIKSADLVIHWSGLTNLLFNASVQANKYKKTLILGPNLIDTVYFDKESKFLKNVKFDKILTVNERLRFLISQKHKISLDKISIFMIGPDLSMWKPIEECDNTILWKGNSRQYVKDVDFAIKIRDKLSHKYKFKFIGYPNPYEYYSHINVAKKSKLYICTSMSETMGLAMAEQWAAGVPSISHPKIYMHGINYITGIITNKNVNDYVNAIEEVMENDCLYKQLSLGCKKYAEEIFSEENIIKNFNKVLNFK